MTDLDTALRAALADDATRAPSPAEEWTGPMLAATARSSSTRRYTRIGLGVAAIAAASAAALVISRDASEDQAVGSGIPEGATEVVLEDLGPASTTVNQVTLTNLSRGVRLPGHPDFVMFRSVQVFDGTAEEWYCSGGPGGGCAPDWMIDAGIASLGVTSTVDNRAGDFNAWTWENVPSPAEYVVFTQAGTTQWARPIAGFVAFPVAGSGLGPYEAAAYNADGVAVKTAAWDEPQPPHVYRAADLTTAQFDELRALTDDALKTCLTTAGATWDASGMLGTLPVAADAESVWDSCVVTTKAAASERLDEWNPRYYDPATERPLADPTPILTEADMECAPLPSDPTIKRCTEMAPASPAAPDAPATPATPGAPATAPGTPGAPATAPG